MKKLNPNMGGTGQGDPPPNQDNPADPPQNDDKTSPN